MAKETAMMSKMVPPTRLKASRLKALLTMKKQKKGC